VIRVLTVLGARPQFVKAAAVSRAIGAHNELCRSGVVQIEETIAHTGQHFDPNMSDVFFRQLGIPSPRFNLGISGLPHGAMTGRMLEQLESLILGERPDRVLVYGDTNSTLAGALAGVKLGIPVVHVEAGLRSRNPSMPEEVNRVLADRVSTVLLCPTEAAHANLCEEGFPFPTPQGHCQTIRIVGDVMLDVLEHVRECVKANVSLDQWGLRHREYVLCTIHRQENTDAADRLTGILMALRSIAETFPVVVPLHPRTRQRIASLSDIETSAITFLPPQPYLEMQRMVMSAALVLTDSGGLQKEAMFHRVPCITLRSETEWPETVESGWNQLAGVVPANIVNAFADRKTPAVAHDSLFGDGHAAPRVVESLIQTI